MSQLKDLTGQRFGRLVVIRREPRNSKNAHWLCQCDCGKSAVVSSPNLTHGQISCGCVRDEVTILRSTKHGQARSKLHMVWCSIKGRTGNPKNKDWENYGGRGIAMCEEWDDDFKAFYEWAFSSGYHEGLAIDRKNNDLGYTPDNCHWVTQAENNRNRRPRRWQKRPDKEVA
jgi:hypothetical protein